MELKDINSFDPHRTSYSMEQLLNLMNNYFPVTPPNLEHLTSRQKNKILLPTIRLLIIPLSIKRSRKDLRRPTKSRTEEGHVDRRRRKLNRIASMEIKLLLIFYEALDRALDLVTHRIAPVTFRIILGLALLFHQSMID